VKPDAISFAVNCASKGERTTVYVGRGLWHVAPLSDIPFAGQRLSGQFCKLKYITKPDKYLTDTQYLSLSGCFCTINFAV